MGVALVAVTRTRTVTEFVGAQRHHHRQGPARRPGQRADRDQSLQRPPPHPPHETPDPPRRLPGRLPNAQQGFHPRLVTTRCARPPPTTGTACPGCRAAPSPIRSDGSLTGSDRKPFPTKTAILSPCHGNAFCASHTAPSSPPWLRRRRKSIGCGGGALRFRRSSPPPGPIPPGERGSRL